LGVFSTSTDHPGLQKRYSTCTGGAGAILATGLTGFAGRTALAVRVGRLRRALARLILDALIIALSRTRRVGFIRLPTFRTNFKNLF
jgi:hypothetical protein